MKQSLSLKLSQNLSLTPQLKQSLKLLQLSSIDLEHEVQQELDNNPLLEKIEIEQPEVTPEENFDTDQIPANQASDEGADINWQETFESKRTSSPTVTRGDDYPELSQLISSQESLHDHLRWQIQMTNLSDKDKLIANTIIDSLDDDGYLTSALDELHLFLDSVDKIELDEIHAVLSLIKTLEPLGVGAKNLGERLTILLNNLPDESNGLEHAKQIIGQHIDLLANHNFSKLKKALELDEAALHQAVSLITQLNPRVGNSFKSDNQAQIIPDIIVKQVNELWCAELNPANQMKLRTNETYSNLLNTKLDDEQSQYIQKNLQQAKIFIKGLMSRYDTLLLVGKAIVEQQQAFFEYGEERMKPMVLQDIALQLEMHESTISRATAGKYLLSSKGVFELKYFFSSALTSNNGVSSSSTAIRSLIKKMIDNEPKVKPLSDSKIADELATQGHSVARRTVAKYRESLHIASSSQRKALM